MRVGIPRCLPRNWANSKILPEFNLDLEITGFEGAEISRLLGELSDPIAHPVDKFPRLRPNLSLGTKSRRSAEPATLELGPHKILCGDALSANDVLRLLSGKAAAIILMGRPPVCLTSEPRAMTATAMT